MKKLFIATLLAIMSLSVWGQSKLSPYTRHYVERIKQEKVADSRQSGKTPLQKKLNTRGQLVIPAFIHLNEGYTPDILTPCGVEVRSVIGQILTADIPFEALDQVAALEGVKYVEMGTPVKPRLNEARKDALVDDVQTGVSLPQEYRGSGVVVGVVDNGFDYTHPDFYTRDKSELRIKRVWAKVSCKAARLTCWPKVFCSAVCSSAAAWVQLLRLIRGVVSCTGTLPLPVSRLWSTLSSAISK